jgi:RNA polymerase sigma-70 factor (ECF subfamily)
MYDHSENELVNGFLHGDEHAFKELHARYFKRLLVFCHGLTNDLHESQDIVSEIFMSLFLRCKKLDFKSINDISAYLFVSARHRSLSALQSRSRRKERHGDLHLADEHAFDTLNDRLDMAFREGLMACKIKETVYGLDQRSVQILRMIYFEDLSYEEISEKMNISINTVRSHRTRGIDILAKIFQRDRTLVEALTLVVFLLVRL